jgi:site-specific DNA recombinase
MSRAVIYCRVSTAKQEDNTSLETQEQGSRAYCERARYSVAAVHKDVHTGADMDRPGLRRAMDAIRQGRADVLVVHALDRLSRNQTHQAVLLYQVQERQARVESVTEKLDDTPIGNFLRQSLSFVAEVEREKIKERMERGKRARAESGVIMPGCRPLYGYLWSGERRTAFIPDPETAPIVQRMFREMANGGTLSSIAKGLQADGIPTPTQYRTHGKRGASSRWLISTVNQLLTNPAYKGEHATYRYTRNSKLREIDDPARVPVSASVCPPLVDTALWERAQRQFVINRTSAFRNNHNHEATLLARGFVFCAHCGNPMHVAKGGNKKSGTFTYYICRHTPNLKHLFANICEYRTRINGKELDALVWGRVQALLQHPEAVKTAIEEMRARESERHAEMQERLSIIDKLVDQHQARRAKLLRSLEDLDDDASKEIAPRIKALGQQIQSLQTERATIQHALDESRFNITAEKVLINADTWESKRKILQDLGVYVSVRAKGHSPSEERVSIVFGWSMITASEMLGYDAAKNVYGMVKNEIDSTTFRVRRHLS